MTMIAEDRSTFEALHQWRRRLHMSEDIKPQTDQNNKSV